MGQSEIFELLKNKRLSGDYSYYSCEQIRKMLKNKDVSSKRNSVNNSIMKLRLFGYLDEKILASRKRNTKYVYNAYRLKREFC